MGPYKVAVIGSGSIGTTIAYTLFLRNLNIDIYLINRNYSKAWAKAFDIGHCSPYLPERLITALSVEDCFNVDVIIMTAGVLPKPNGTRADVIKDNIEIFNSTIPILAKNNPNALFINITNPVDSMAYAIQKISGFSSSKVIGTGTELDAMRMKKILQDNYNLEANKILIDIIGEHGDSMVPVWGGASYQNANLDNFVPNFNSNEKDKVLDMTKKAGWEIRQAGEHSCYAIAFTTVRIIESIINESNTYFLITSLVSGELEAENVYMSLPTKFKKNAVHIKKIPELDEKELIQFSKSYAYLQKQIEEVEKLL